MNSQHIEHIEDLPFIYGNGGIQQVMNILYEIQNYVQGCPSNSKMHLNIKYDGSPSIIYGHNGMPFVATKSIFNKESKVFYTNESIDEYYLSDKYQLAETLKICLKYLPEIGSIKGYIQGDLLYTTNDLYFTENNLNFRPNAILYSVNKKSTLGEQILKSKLGVIWHTFYPNGNLNEAQYNIPLINSTENVWCRDASITIPQNMLNESEEEDFSDSIDTIWKCYENCSVYFMNKLSINETIKKHTKTYLNECIKLSRCPSVMSLNGLMAYIKVKTNESINDAKKPETKENKLQEQKEILDFITEYKKEIHSLFNAWVYIAQFEQIFIEKLSTIDTGFNMFLEVDGKLQKSSHEGFVLTDKTNDVIVKIVDRYSFSKANFQNNKWN